MEEFKEVESNGKITLTNASRPADGRLWFCERVPDELHPGIRRGGAQTTGEWDPEKVGKSIRGFLA